MDVARRAHKKQRKTNIPGNGSGNITFQQYNDIRKRTKRICYSLSDYEKYVKTIKPHKNAAKCAVCGEITYKRCQLCNVPLHHHDIKGPGKGKNCGIHYHMENYIGLCYGDRNLVGLNGKNWKQWSNLKLRRNTKLIEGYASQY